LDHNTQLRNKVSKTMDDEKLGKLITDAAEKVAEKLMAFSDRRLEPDAPTNNDIIRAIGNLEGTVGGIDKKLDEGTKRMDSHSKRIGSVERKQSWYAGGAMVGGGFFGAMLKKMGVL